MKKTSLAYTERVLLSQAKTHCLASPVFIIGSPRTGSTFLYQAIVDVFGLPYISNLTNDHFAQYPILGIALQRGIKVNIDYKSSFGKTQGTLQPSEGSAVMMKWFGGGHPSQVVSTSILEGQELHFLETLTAVEAIYNGSPLLIKNAWNCFRIHYLAKILPNAKFIWIRRDIAESAKSDLEARYLTQGSADTWNSATPSNWEQLKQQPPYIQVVENQFEFNKAIGKSLRESASNRSIEMWYEDFLDSYETEFLRLEKFLEMSRKKSIIPNVQSKSKVRQILENDTMKLMNYINIHADRLAPYRYI